MSTLPSPHPHSPIVYPAWATTDNRIAELAEWLHNRDHRTEAHSWTRAPLDERLSYCADAQAALVFIDTAPTPTPTDALMTAALTDIADTFDTGGTTPLAYHNQAHTLDVIRDAVRIAERSNLDARSRELLRIAAAYHDVTRDEIESAGIAADRMHATGAFTESEIRDVRDAILSTTVSFDTGSLVQQLHDSRGQHLQPALMDADLASLGYPFDGYWRRAERLLHEITGTSAPSPEQFDAFIVRQVALLEGHRFRTTAATDLYPHAEANATILLTDAGRAASREATATS